MNVFTCLVSTVAIMATLWNMAGHYIFILWFLLSSFFSSPILSRCTFDVYHISTRRGLSANLECRSERGALKIQDAKIAKNSPSAHHRTTLLGCIFLNKVCIDNRKKIVKQQYLLHVLTIWRTSAH